MEHVLTMANLKLKPSLFTPPLLGRGCMNSSRADHWLIRLHTLDVEDFSKIFQKDV